MDHSALLDAISGAPTSELRQVLEEDPSLVERLRQIMPRQQAPTTPLRPFVLAIKATMQRDPGMGSNISPACFTLTIDGALRQRLFDALNAIHVAGLSYAGVPVAFAAPTDISLDLAEAIENDEYVVVRDGDLYVNGGQASILDTHIKLHDDGQCWLTCEDVEHDETLESPPIDLVALVSANDPADAEHG